MLTDSGRAAIESSAPANGARVRELFIDVLGPERLAALRHACDEVIAVIGDHLEHDCPPNVRGG